MPSPKDDSLLCSAILCSLPASFSSAICLSLVPCQQSIQKAPGSRSDPPLSRSHTPSSLRGERYIGMWQADQRHGPGVVVTQAGVCYQGTFQGDKMAVSSSPCLGHCVGPVKAKPGG